MLKKGKTMKLGPNQKELVKALRSGEYKQVQGKLHVDDGFCCLGVSSDIFIKKTEQLSWQTGSLDVYNDDDGVEHRIYAIDGCVGLLPWLVQDYFKFKSPSGQYGDRGDENLTHLNDVGVNFDAIADVIENNPDKVFTEPA